MYKLPFFYLFFISNYTLGQSVVYVHSGLTNGNGTSGSPYNEIKTAINSVTPGGTIYLRPGIYYPDLELYIDKSLTLKKELNSTGNVVIDFSNRQQLVINFSRYGLGIVNCSNVTIDSIRFQNYIDTFFNKAIYVLNNDDNIKMRNIKITNCSFYNIGWVSKDIKKRPRSSAVSCNVIIVEGKKSKSIDSTVIMGNTITNCALGWGEAVTLTGNVDSFLIEKNTIDSISNIGLVVAGLYNTSAPTLLNQARNGKIKNNTISRCMSSIAVASGVYLDGSRNCIVENNLIYLCGAGISIGAEETILDPSIIVGNHNIRNNIVIYNAIAGLYIGADTNSRFVKNCYIKHNNFYRNATGDTINGVQVIGANENALLPISTVMQGSNGEILLYNSENITFENNIIYAFNGRRFFVGMNGRNSSVNNSINFKSNHNLFYKEDGNIEFDFASQHSFNNSPLNTTYTTLPFLTEDYNSKFGNPKFKNVSLNNFKLDTCSAAINMGNPIFNAQINGNTDFAGSIRNFGIVDAGAHEFESNNVCLSSFNLISVTPQCNGNLSEMKILWNKSLNAIRYSIYRDTGIVLPTTFYKQTNDTTFTDIVTPFKNYSYKIKAVSNADSVFQINLPKSNQAMACTTTNITLINNVPLNITLSPNPNNGLCNLFITSTSNFTINSLFVINSIGKLVLQNNNLFRGVQFQKQIDVRKFAASNYFIKINIKMANEYKIISIPFIKL